MKIDRNAMTPLEIKESGPIERHRFEHYSAAHLRDLDVCKHCAKPRSDESHQGSEAASESKPTSDPKPSEWQFGCACGAWRSKDCNCGGERDPRA